MKNSSFFAVFILPFLVSFCALLVAQNMEGLRESGDFYAKMAEITQHLYKISADQLQEMLGCNYSDIPTIEADELQHKMANNQDLMVINVLPKNLFDDCHIVGSHSVPLKELIDTVADWPRDREIIVYCALTICDAGQKAYVLLSCMGFTNVCDYEGGIKEWYQLGYPTNGPASCAYLHTRIAKLPDELAYEIAGCCGITVP